VLPWFYTQVKVKRIPTGSYLEVLLRQLEVFSETGEVARFSLYFIVHEEKAKNVGKHCFQSTSVKLSQ
jgi:hypothetical protein